MLTLVMLDMLMMLKEIPQCEPDKKAKHIHIPQQSQHRIKMKHPIRFSARKRVKRLNIVCVYVCESWSRSLCVYVS